MLIGQSLPKFVDSDGSPLNNGSIYFGAVNNNPEISPVAIYWDVNLTQPVSQPVKTINGFISRDGTPSNVYVSGPYSITVKNKKGILLLTFPDSSNFDAVSASYAAAISAINASILNANYCVDNVAALKLVDKTKFSYVSTRGYFVANDNGNGSYIYDPLDTTSLDNGGNIIVANDGARWKLENTDFFSIEQFGAKGDGVTDDTASFNSAASTNLPIFVTKPSASYKLASAVVGGNFVSTLPITISGAGSVTIANIANAIQKTGTQSVSAILQFPNNVNNITQSDQYGTQQNIIYLDADNGCVMGGSDVRLTWLGAQALNMFRQHHHFRFTQISALDPRLSQITTGAGSILFSSGKLFLRSGAGAAGDGIELRSGNIPVPIIAGQRIYFYLECPTATNFTLEFGINTASGSGTFAKFTRTDVGAESNVFCKVSNGAAVSSVDTLQKVGTTRRLYCIEIVSATIIKMYVSTTGGVLTLYATFTSGVDQTPTSTCYVFIKINSSGVAVNKEVLLSQIYEILIE